MYKIIALIAAGAPLIALGQGFNTFYLRDILVGIQLVLEPAVLLLMAGAVLLFVWGVVIFIANANDEKARTEGKQRMVWGIVGLFIIVSMWGIVALLQSTFTFGGDAPAQYSPQATF